MTARGEGTQSASPEGPAHISGAWVEAICAHEEDIVAGHGRGRALLQAECRVRESVSMCSLSIKEQTLIFTKNIALLALQEAHFQQIITFAIEAQRTFIFFFH